MTTLNDLLIKLQKKPASIDNTIEIGNQPRVGASINVGWPAVDILRAEDSQTRIETKGIGTCYGMFGINPHGDVIIGHYYATMPRQLALDSARTLIEGENKKSQRKLDCNDFQFKFYPGPVRISKTSKLQYVNPDGEIISEGLPSQTLPYRNIGYDRADGFYNILHVPEVVKKLLLIPEYENQYPLIKVELMENKFNKLYDILPTLTKSRVMGMV